jgi:hypothetical protein
LIGGKFTYGTSASALVRNSLVQVAVDIRSTVRLGWRRRTEILSLFAESLYRRPTNLNRNSQTRSDDALKEKLNAIADALAELMESQSAGDKEDDVKDLRPAVGLEDRASA